jgi:proteasome lid subunit RPN8/RPN11
VTGRFLYLSDALAAQILNAAARSYPRECCGLIEGMSRADGWHATAMHETANVADDPARHFLIDPQVQFDRVRALRGTERAIIGCFHSHPDGAAVPSATDRVNAFETDFLWLIVGGSAAEGFTLAAHAFRQDVDFVPVVLRRESSRDLACLDPLWARAYKRI